MSNKVSRGSAAYSFRLAEKHSRELWSRHGSLESKKRGKRRFMCMAQPIELEERISLGHCRNQIITDVVARQQRMLGKNVLHVAAWDSAGIQAQLAARDAGESPSVWSKRCEKKGRELFEQLGIGADWNGSVSTVSAEHRRSQQELFLDLWKTGKLISPQQSEGVAYWDPGVRAFLSLRQLVNGRGPKSGMLVEIRKVKSYEVSISKQLATDLLRDLDKISEWDSFVRNMQRESIGLETGLTITFPVHGQNNKKWKPLLVFTSRPDTLMGTTFLAVGTRHQLALEVAKENESIANFCAEINDATYAYRKMAEDKRQEGMPLGLYAVNPINGDHIPIWVANFVVADYGTEALLGVPAHDQRNFNFAQRHNLPMRRVETIGDADLSEPLLQPITDKHALPTGCDALSKALRSCKQQLLAEAQSGSPKNALWQDNWDNEISSCVKEQLEMHGIEAKKTTVARLRNWKISAQGYWGTPVPLVHCGKCGVVPVPKKLLPIELPAYEEGKDSLAEYPSFVACKCPKCGGSAKRDTDTLARLFDVSWLHVEAAGQNAADWLPVDFFCGGVQNATSQLLSMRILQRLMRNVSGAKGEKPARFLLSQGMVLNYGLPMRSAYANTIEAGDLLDECGADVLRLYLGASENPRRSLHWDNKKLFALHGILSGEEFAALRAGKLKGIKLEQAKANLSPHEYGRLTEGLLDRSEYAALRRGRLSGKKAKAAAKLVDESAIARLRHGIISKRELRDLRSGKLEQEKIKRLENEFSELEMNRLRSGLLNLADFKNLHASNPPKKIAKRATAAIGEANLKKVLAAKADPDQPGAIAKLQEQLLDPIEQKALDEAERDRRLLLEARKILDENDLRSLQRGLLSAAEYKALRSGRLRGSKLAQVKTLLSDDEYLRISRGALERDEMMLFRRGRLPAKQMKALARRLGKDVDLRCFQAKTIDAKKLAAAKASLPDRRRLAMLRAGTLPDSKLAQLRRKLGTKQLEAYLNSMMDEQTFNAAAGFLDPERQALLVNFIDAKKQRALAKALSAAQRGRLRELGTKRSQPPLLGFLDKRRMDQLLCEVDGKAMDTLVNFIDPGRLEQLLGFNGMLWHVVVGKATMAAAAGKAPCRDKRRIKLHHLIDAIDVLYSGSQAVEPGEENRLSLNRVQNRARELIELIEVTADLHDPDDCALVAEGINALLRLLHPLIPHVTEQLWQHLGFPGILAEAKWPKANKRLLERSGDQNVIVQENGNMKLGFTMAAAASPRLLRDEARKRLREEAQKSGFPSYPQLGRKVMRVECASRRRDSVVNFVVVPEL